MLVYSIVEVQVRFLLTDKSDNGIKPILIQTEGGWSSTQNLSYW